MDGHLLRFDKEKTYALIDCETFNLGLTFLVNRPWQIGIIKFDGNGIIESKDILINWKHVCPHLKISYEAALLTHYSQEKVDTLGIDPKDAFKQFWPILKEVDYIMMHNGLKFDLYLLKDYAKFMGEDWKFIVPKIIDTKAIAQGVKLNLPYNPKVHDFLEYQYKMANNRTKGIKTKLSILASEYGIDFDENKLHDAIYDLELNKKVWDKLKYQLEL